MFSDTKPADTTGDRRLWRGYLIAIALSLGVTVSNSFARFAYALVLPAMRAELSLSYAQAGWLNTANAIGYLIGALGTRLIAGRFGSQRGLFSGCVALTALAVLATGLMPGLAGLAACRLVAGVVGAVAFICGGALAANISTDQPQAGSTMIAIYFAGGGIGFLLCGLTIPLWLDARGSAGWPQAWIAMGGVGFACWAAAAWAAAQIAEPQAGGAASSKSSALDAATIASTAIVDRHNASLRAAMVGYTMFGIGYIGYMTFVIAWMRDNGAPTADVIAVWMTFGLASVLGPWLWRYPLRHWSGGSMLSCALAVLALGAALPLLDARFAPMLVSAALFGSAMWNVPSAITNLVKQQRLPSRWAPAVATFTSVFAAGQVVGPVMTGWLADWLGSLRPGLIGSVAVLALGAVIAAFQRKGPL